MSTLSRRPARSVSPTQKFAVLIDGSALFLATRVLEERKLNYFKLIEILTQHPLLQGLRAAGEDPDAIWTMWTAADPRNAGQVKFLEFAEQRLHWETRCTPPHLAHMIEPDTLFGFGEATASKAGRLIRFDAQIAFAMGALGSTHRLVVLTDSFAHFESMVRVNQNWAHETGGKVVLTFFGHACDSRWRAALRASDAPDFIDLDDYSAELFGQQQQEVISPTRGSSRFVY